MCRNFSLKQGSHLWKVTFVCIKVSDIAEQEERAEEEK